MEWPEKEHINDQEDRCGDQNTLEGIDKKIVNLLQNPHIVIVDYIQFFVNRRDLWRLKKSTTHFETEKRMTEDHPLILFLLMIFQKPGLIPKNDKL